MAPDTVPDLLTGLIEGRLSRRALAARAAALGLAVAETPPTFDIDEDSDLDVLRAALAPDVAAAPATWAALRDLGLDADPVDH